MPVVETSQRIQFTFAEWDLVVAALRVNPSFETESIAREIEFKVAQKRKGFSTKEAPNKMTVASLGVITENLYRDYLYKIEQGGYMTLEQICSVMEYRGMHKISDELDSEVNNIYMKRFNDSTSKGD